MPVPVPVRVPFPPREIYIYIYNISAFILSCERTTSITAEPKKKQKETSRAPTNLEVTKRGNKQASKQLHSATSFVVFKSLLHTPSISQIKNDFSLRFPPKTTAEGQFLFAPPQAFPAAGVTADSNISFASVVAFIFGRGGGKGVSTFCEEVPRLICQRVNVGVYTLGGESPPWSQQRGPH